MESFLQIPFHAEGQYVKQIEVELLSLKGAGPAAIIIWPSTGVNPIGHS